MSLDKDNDNGINNSHALKLYEQDVRLRQQQVSLREKEADNAHTYGMAALEARERDEEKKRKHIDAIHARNTKSGTVILALIAALCAFVIYIGEGDILLELIKYFVVGMGSYFWGKSKRGN